MVTSAESAAASASAAAVAEAEAEAEAEAVPLDGSVSDSGSFISWRSCGRKEEGHGERKEGGSEQR